VTEFWPPTFPEKEYGHNEDQIVSEKDYETLVRTNEELTPDPDILAKMAKAKSEERKEADHEIALRNSFHDLSNQDSPRPDDDMTLPSSGVE
jgi:hypothetical protein